MTILWNKNFYDIDISVLYYAYISDLSSKNPQALG